MNQPGNALDPMRTWVGDPRAARSRAATAASATVTCSGPKASGGSTRTPSSARPRRQRDVRRRVARAAAAVAAPTGDGRRSRAQRLPHRPVASAPAHRRLPGGDHVRSHGRGGAASCAPAVHERAVGVAPDGRPYAANDPHLLRWVHVAEVDSFLAAHQRYGETPLLAHERDEYVREMAVIAGARRARPARVRAPCATRSAFRPELQGTPAAREAALHAPATADAPCHPSHVHAARLGRGGAAAAVGAPTAAPAVAAGAGAVAVRPAGDVSCAACGGRSRTRRSPTPSRRRGGRRGGRRLTKAAGESRASAGRGRRGR